MKGPGISQYTVGPQSLCYNKGGRTLITEQSFDSKVGSWRTTKKVKPGCPLYYFGRPHFVTLLYMYVVLVLTLLLFLGKTKVT